MRGRAASATLAALAATTVGVASATNQVVAFGLILFPAVLALSFLRPLAGLGLWLGVVLFIPEWTTVNVIGIPLRAYLLAALPVLAGVILSPRLTSRFKPAGADFALLGGVGLVAWFTLAGSTPLFALVNVVGAMALPYLIGRMCPPPTQSVLCLLVAAVAIWGLAEVATGFHLFANWMPGTSHHWGDIQTRAGFTRAEATMGHAISFGAVCALCIPFATRLRRPRLIVALLVLGVVASLSRGPLIALVATAGLGVLFLAPRGRRVAATAGFVTVGLVAGLVLQFVYSGADGSDVALSGQQRAIQLRNTIESIRWFEPAFSQIASDGSLVTASVDTIDSTPLRFALNYGWLGAFLLLAPFIYTAIRVTTTRAAGPASLALLGQLPVMLVTTLITQWQVVILVVAGMAVTESNRMRQGAPIPPSRWAQRPTRVSHGEPGGLAGAACDLQYQTSKPLPVSTAPTSPRVTTTRPY